MICLEIWQYILALFIAGVSGAAGNDLFRRWRARKARRGNQL